jgi:hypothetical protein
MVDAGKSIATTALNRPSTGCCGPDRGPNQRAELGADLPGTALELTNIFSVVVALIPRWRYMTDGSKAIVKRAAISVLVIFLSLTILRVFLNYIILAVIIFAALQLFNRK